jgi:membrane protease YdiL (CAAX protease family)
MYRSLTIVGASSLTVLTFVVIVPLLHLLAAAVAIGYDLSYAQAFQRISADPLYLAAATIVGVGVSLVAGKAWMDPDAPWMRVLFVSRVPLRIVALALVVGFALQLPLAELSNLTELVFPVSVEQKEFIHRVMTPKGCNQVLTTLLALVVIVPICEEMLFRGLLLRGLNYTYGAVPALLVSSILFGLSHLRLPTAILPAMVAGLFLGLIALRTGSIWPSIALHAAVNAIPVVVSPEIVLIRGFNDVHAEVSHIPIALLTSSCLISLIAFFILLSTANNGSEPGQSVPSERRPDNQ